MSRGYRIRLDRSASSVVVVCTCGWRAIRTRAPAAHSAALDHERACHPGGRQAYMMVAKATERRAGDCQHPCGA